MLSFGLPIFSWRERVRVDLRWCLRIRAWPLAACVPSQPSLSSFPDAASEVTLTGKDDNCNWELFAFVIRTHVLHSPSLIEGNGSDIGVGGGLKKTKVAAWDGRIRQTEKNSGRYLSWLCPPACFSTDWSYGREKKTTKGRSQLPQKRLKSACHERQCGSTSTVSAESSHFFRITSQIVKNALCRPLRCPRMSEFSACRNVWCRVTETWSRARWRQAFETSTGVPRKTFVCELLQVVQHNALHCVSCGVHADDGELVASTGAVLPVAHLVASDHAVLQVLVGRLPWTRNNQSPYEETIDE